MGIDLEREPDDLAARSDITCNRGEDSEQAGSD